MITNEAAEHIASKIVALAENEDGYFKLQRTVCTNPNGILEFIQKNIIRFVSETVVDLNTVIGIQFPAREESVQILDSIRRIYLNDFLRLKDDLSARFKKSF